MAIDQAEQKLLNYLERLYLEGAKYREKWSKNWKRSIEVMSGKVWPEKRPNYKVPAAMNFLAQVVEKKAALLTDSRPTMQITHRRKGSGLDPLCDLLYKTIEAIFEEINFEQRLTEFVLFEEFFGTAFTHTCFDASLDYGRGDVDLVILDPRSCVFDPFVMRTYRLSNAEYFCLETIRPTEYLKDKYGKKADDIKNDFSVDTQTREDSLFAKLRQLFGAKVDADRIASSVVPRSIVRDYWIRDRSTREEKKLKYPTWREVLVAGGCIVEDGGNRYIDGNLPFDGMEWDFNVDSAYGFSEVTKLETPQLMFNKVLATAIENLMLMGNAIWIGDYNALTEKEWERLSNEPGLYVKKRPSAELRREAGVPLPPYTTNILNLLLTGLEKLSSITEVTEGRRPGQVTSGVAIEALQLAASTAIRLKARQLEALIQRIGQKLISRIFQYYTEDRVFNLMGADERFNQFVYERAKVREILDKEGINVTKAFQDFQFKVIPASSLALTKWQKGLIAMQLYQAGAIDREALLEALEYPNREEILARTMEKQQAGVEPIGGRSRGQKLPKSVLRGGHRETGMQFPQVGG